MQYIQSQINNRCAFLARKVPLNFERHFLRRFSCIPTISTFNSTVCKTLFLSTNLMTLEIELRIARYVFSACAHTHTYMMLARDNIKDRDVFWRCFKWTYMVGSLCKSIKGNTYSCFIIVGTTLKACIYMIWSISENKANHHKNRIRCKCQKEKKAQSICSLCVHNKYVIIKQIINKGELAS